MDTMRRTKIVATLGPATDDPQVMAGMVRAGLDVARINFSHGTRDSQIRRIELVRQAARDALILAQAESEAPPSNTAFAAADLFLADAPEPKLPVSGADLMARGVAAGRPVGGALRTFQALWIRAGFPKEPEMLARLLEAAVAETARGEERKGGRGEAPSEGGAVPR